MTEHLKPAVREAISNFEYLIDWLKQNHSCLSREETLKLAAQLTMASAVHQLDSKISSKDYLLGRLH